MNWTDWLYLLLFILGILTGGLLTVFQLPGTWLILLISALYAWGYDFQKLSIMSLLILAGIALLAEVAELLAGMKGAQKFGASRQASWGALLGGILGMIALTPLIPIPIVGSIMGGLIGCFAGAFIAERNTQSDYSKSTKVGFGAALGRLAGLLIKIIASMLMSGVAIGLVVFNLF